MRPTGTASGFILFDLFAMHDGTMALILQTSLLSGLLSKSAETAKANLLKNNRKRGCVLKNLSLHRLLYGTRPGVQKPKTHRPSKAPPKKKKEHKQADAWADVLINRLHYMLPGWGGTEGRRDAQGGS
jgi:hypothetical protein